MKFGGTSVADGPRLLGVCELVRRHLDRKPVVVVSALAGVTDLLEQAAAAACQGELEAQQRALADLERRHRWAVSGAVDSASGRHDLTLGLDALFDELRDLLRSIRTLGELTPRASDVLLSLGETLSARILASVLAEQGLPAREVDARQVMITDGNHGAAQPEPSAVDEGCRTHILPLLEAGELPLLGGYVGATAAGETTTLGRGGSDTSAAVLGSALGAEEIQIWTDVDGLMSADPKLVSAARTLPRISFAEAAELANFGARVLHPASISPAVKHRVPVRVLNTLNPAGEGTVILEQPAPDAPPLAAIASRGGLRTLRLDDPKMKIDPELVPWLLETLRSSGVAPELLLSSETGLTLVVEDRPGIGALVRSLKERARVKSEAGKAILCVVGWGLAGDPAVRRRVLAALSELAPELVAIGNSGCGATALVEESDLESAVRTTHRTFFEEVEPS